MAWSRAAVASENVKAEARRARNRGKLLQVYLESCEPPLFFGERQGVDLSGWGDGAHDHFPSVNSAVGALLDGQCRHEEALQPAPPVATSVWEHTSKSENIDELEAFIETFPATREAVEARKRIKKLKSLSLIRETDELITIGDLQGASDEEVEVLFLHLKDIDDFWDRLPDSEWEPELRRVRATVSEILASIDPYDAEDGSQYSYSYYMYERARTGQPDRD